MIAEQNCPLHMSQKAVWTNLKRKQVCVCALQTVQARVPSRIRNAAALDGPGNKERRPKKHQETRVGDYGTGYGVVLYCSALSCAAPNSSPPWSWLLPQYEICIARFILSYIIMTVDHGGMQIEQESGVAE